MRGPDAFITRLDPPAGVHRRVWRHHPRRAVKQCFLSVIADGLVQNEEDFAVYGNTSYAGYLFECRVR